MGCPWLPTPSRNVEQYASSRRAKQIYRERTTNIKKSWLTVRILTTLLTTRDQFPPRLVIYTGSLFCWMMPRLAHEDSPISRKGTFKGWKTRWRARNSIWSSMLCILIICLRQNWGHGDRGRNDSFYEDRYMGAMQWSLIERNGWDD